MPGQNKKDKKGKTSKELMKRQIHDQNAVITEEELRDLVIETDLPVDEGQEPLDISNNKERPKDEDKDPKVVTPWNIISE